MKKLSKEDDCGCGRPLKVTDPRRRKAGAKKTVPKRKPPR